MIVVAGEALIDLVIAPDGAVTVALGGAPFNAARAAARLGASVQFLGAVSCDRFGTLLLDRLVSDGVGVDLAPRTEHPSTLAAAELDPSGGAHYRFYIEGTSAPQLTVADVGSIGSAPEVLFTGGLALVLEPMADSICALIEGLPDTTAVFVDVNCRPNVITDRAAYLDCLELVLRRADVVKVSDEDLDYLLPGVETSTAADELLSRGPAAVVVTRGSHATFIAAIGGQREVPVAPTTASIVDTIGAGDTFGGAFLTAWTKRGGSCGGLRAAGALDELTSVVGAAHAAAAVVVTRLGANPPWRYELPDTWAT